MKHKIYKGGVDNYPLWWYGQKSRLTNFGDRPNFLTPHGAMFQKNGYYFNGSDDYMEDIYGRHLIREGTDGLWSQLYLTDSAVPSSGSVVGTGNRLYLSKQEPKITGKIVLLPEYCPNIEHFLCGNNLISSLDVSQIIKLYYLLCNYNQISTLDISRLTNLNFIYCNNNQISILDIGQLIKLRYLYCNYNQISTLNVSQLTELVELHCGSNQIFTLDVSQDSQITLLICYNNQMDQSAVDKVLCDANAWNTSDGTLDISGNTAPSSTGTDCANDMINRNWTVTTD